MLQPDFWRAVLTGRCFGLPVAGTSDRHRPGRGAGEERQHLDPGVGGGGDHAVDAGPVERPALGLLDRAPDDRDPDAVDPAPLQALQLFGGRRRLRDDAPEVGGDGACGRGEPPGGEQAIASASRQTRISAPEAFARLPHRSSSLPEKRARRARGAVADAWRISTTASEIAARTNDRDQDRDQRRGAAVIALRRAFAGGLYGLLRIAVLLAGGRRWLGYPAGRSRCRHPPCSGAENSSLDCLPPSLKPRCRCTAAAAADRRCWSAWSRRPRCSTSSPAVLLAAAAGTRSLEPPRRSPSARESSYWGIEQPERDTESRPMPAEQALTAARGRAGRGSGAMAHPDASRAQG